MSLCRCRRLFGQSVPFIDKVNFQFFGPHANLVVQLLQSNGQLHPILPETIQPGLLSSSQ